MDSLNRNKEKNEIRLRWFGHSCFRLEIGCVCFYFDPVRKNRMLMTTLKPEVARRASAIFVSHEHWDHYDAETVLALCSDATKIYCPVSVASLLRCRMSFEAGNMRELECLTKQIISVKEEDVINVDESHGVRVKCLDASEGLSFLIDCDGWRVLFMGDSVATDEMVSEKPDVVLFPVWAVTGEESKPEEFLALAKERTCIPMHYHTSPDALPNFFIGDCRIQDLLPEEVNMRILERDRVYHI